MIIIVIIIVIMIINKAPAEEDLAARMRPLQHSAEVYMRIFSWLAETRLAQNT